MKIESEVKIDMSYLDFLSLIQDVSKNSNSIQRNILKTTYQNFDIQLIKSNLDIKITDLDRLLTK